MFSRSLGRIAIRQPLRSTNGRIGSTVARRGLSTSGTSRNPTASKNATTLAIMALVSGGVLYNFESMRSKKIYLEGENKSDSEEEKKELKEEKKKSGEGKSKSQKKKSEVKDEEKEESSKDNEKKEEVEDASPVDMDELSEDASQQSAFDPETNTINWDCPCLGGMAHGPCGEQFKEAFSCFVFSEEEVKGVDCIEKFKGMQDCFRKYPEHYKEELEDEAEFERSEAEQAKGDEGKDKSSNSPDDDDEGLREWRAEMEKEK